MSHMQACRKIHDRCDCNALELSEELNELKAAFGRELQQALTRIANLETEKALAVAAASDFYGPCAHGRDPYTRCHTCGNLTPTQAMVAAAVAAETEACAKAVEDSGLDVVTGVIAAAIRGRGAK